PAVRARGHLLRAARRPGRCGRYPARPLGPEGVRRLELLRRLPRAPVGGARLGAVRRLRAAGRLGRASAAHEQALPARVRGAAVCARLRSRVRPLRRPPAPAPSGERPPPCGAQRLRFAAPCTYTRLIPRPSPHPTTTPSALRWRVPAPRSS